MEGGKSLEHHIPLPAIRRTVRLQLREGAEKKRKTNDGISIIRRGGSLIFHHFPSFQQFFFLASKWPNSSRNAKKKISIFGDPPSYSASSQAFYVKILNI